MIELVNHIKSINEKSKKDMDANPYLWIGHIVEDPKHWEEYGITTRPLNLTGTKTNVVFMRWLPHNTLKVTPEVLEYRI